MKKSIYVFAIAIIFFTCKKENPFLKEIEKKYHGKNIEFVSISVDKQKVNDACVK